MTATRDSGLATLGKGITMKHDFRDAECNQLSNIFHPDVPAKVTGDASAPYYQQAVDICSHCKYTGIGNECYNRWLEAGRPAEVAVWFGFNPMDLRRLKRSGRSPRPTNQIPQETRTLIRQMSKQGWTAAALSDRHKVDVRTIRNILNET